MKNANSSNTAKNKFEEMSRMELLRLCLELEDENEKLRPKPPRFKLGQLVAYYEPKMAPGAFKHPWHPGQPAIYFTVLSLELKNEGWFYGHTRTSAQNFAYYPEKKCRELTEMELKGQEPLDAPGPMEVQAPGLAQAHIPNMQESF